MLYIYHYHAFTQESVGTLTHYSGLIRRPDPIESGDDFNSVKALIVQNEGVPLERLTIASLSFLGLASH